jgi:hypothetical protein
MIFFLELSSRWLLSGKDETEFLPQFAWTLLGKQNTAVNLALANVWSFETAFSNFASSLHKRAWTQVP